MTAAALLVVGSSSALPLTSLRIDRLITFLDMSVDPNDAGIEDSDPFAIEATFDETLIAALGTETLILGTDAASTFDLTVRDAITVNPLFRQNAADDLLEGLCLRCAAARSIASCSSPPIFGDLGTATFSQVEAVQAGAAFPPSGGARNPRLG